MARITHIRKSGGGSFPTGVLFADNNLSDVDDVEWARSNLGVAYSSENGTPINAAGTTTVLMGTGEVSTHRIYEVAAGAGGYTHTLVLGATGATVGCQLLVTVRTAAQRNGYIVLRNNTPGGTVLADVRSNGNVVDYEFRFVRRSDGNWELVSRSPASVWWDITTTTAPAGMVNFSNTSSQVRWEGSLPVGWQSLYVEGLGGGGGGGSGARGAAGTNRSGGGGGAGGCWCDGSFVRNAAWVEAQNGDRLFAAIGLGGPGGAEVTTDNTAGNAGASGGTTEVAMGGGYGAPGGANRLIYPAGGLGGAGGVLGTTAAGGAPAPITVIQSGSFGGAGNAAVNGADGQHCDNRAAAGGGGGGGISSADANTNGGKGGRNRTYWHMSPTEGLGGTTPGGGGGSVTITATSQIGMNLFGGPGAGAGAGGNNAVSGGAGGNGDFGSGGGGGGASLNGFVSGAGGNGGNGRARVTIYF